MSIPHSTQFTYPDTWSSRASELDPLYLDDLLPLLDPANPFDECFPEDKRHYLYHKLMPTRSTYMCRDRDFTDNRPAAFTIQNLESHQYVALGGGVYRSVIVMDFDDTSQYRRLMEFPLAPNLIGMNARGDHRGHMQAIWVLSSPVSTRHPKRMIWLDRIMSAMKRALGADPFFSNSLSRSPWCRNGDYNWRWVHDNEHDMYALTTACGLAGQPLEHTRKVVPESSGNDKVAGRYVGPRIGPESDPEMYRPLRVSMTDDSLVLRNCWVFLASTELASNMSFDSLTENWVVDAVFTCHAFLTEYLSVHDGYTTDGNEMTDGELYSIAMSIYGYWSRGGKGIASSFTLAERSRGGMNNYQKHSVEVNARLEQGRALSLETRRERARRRVKHVARMMRRALDNRTIMERLEERGMSVSRTTLWRDKMYLLRLPLDALIDLLGLHRDDVSFVVSQVDNAPSQSTSPCRRAGRNEGPGRFGSYLHDDISIRCSI